jgi:hypothetical protein
MTKESALTAVIEQYQRRIAELEEALRKVRTPFASTLTHEQALERLREINKFSYAVLGDGNR